jgi:transcriptional regulator with XRE-family HTH domain
MRLPPENSTDAQHFGFVLYALRNAAGFSRAKLAKLARLSEGTIKNCEAGNHFPSPTTLARLMSVSQLRLTTEVVSSLFAVSSLVHVDYEIERHSQVTRQQTEIVVRLTLTFNNKRD